MQNIKPFQNVLSVSLPEHLIMKAMTYTKLFNLFAQSGINNNNNNNNNICICIAPLPKDTKRCCLYYYPVRKSSQSFRFT